MRPPYNIRIGGHNYKVKYVPSPIVDNQEVHGAIKYSIRTITIDSTPPNKIQEVNTVLHECIHGILEERGIKHSENLVHNLSNGLVALLKDNPKLRRYLLENI